MAPELLKAHAQLDRAIDAVFGLKGTVTNDQRLAALFASHQAMTQPEQLRLRGRRLPGQQPTPPLIWWRHLGPRPVQVGPSNGVMT